jgi:predicted enzyme related to lactoylglutathione lyase
MIYWRYDEMKEAGMYSSYTLKADELTDGFLRGIKETYGKREIEIVVYDVEDETEYLMKSKANREHLDRAISNIESGKNLVTVSMEDL